MMYDIRCTIKNIVVRCTYIVVRFMREGLSGVPTRRKPDPSMLPKLCDGDIDGARPKINNSLNWVRSKLLCQAFRHKRLCYK